jgi:hypothetical protein
LPAPTATHTFEGSQYPYLRDVELHRPQKLGGRR